MQFACDKMTLNSVLSTDIPYYTVHVSEKTILSWTLVVMLLMSISTLTNQKDLLFD